MFVLVDLFFCLLEKSLHDSEDEISLDAKRRRCLFKIWISRKISIPSPHLNAEGFFIFMNVGCDHRRFATIRTGQSSLAGRTCITAWTPGRTITAPSARDTRQSSLACLPVRRFLLLSQVRWSVLESRCSKWGFFEVSRFQGYSRFFERGDAQSASTVGVFQPSPSDPAQAAQYEPWYIIFEKSRLWGADHFSNKENAW